MKLRVVSWNLGGTFYAAQRERAWHYLCALDPDIALLQEARPPEWTHTRFQFAHGKKVGPWCSLIAARDLSLERIPLERVAPAFFDRYVACALAISCSATGRASASEAVGLEPTREPWTEGSKVG